MTENPPKQGNEVSPQKDETLEEYVRRTYKEKIEYYWRASGHNKKNYKQYRYWTTILGALVTLVASLNTAVFISDNPILDPLFSIATPVLAATLTVISGISQSFQWGSTWRDMTVNAQRLEKERDRFLATPRAEHNYLKELEIINDTIMDETQSFFQRVLDSEIIPSKSAPAGQKVG